MAGETIQLTKKVLHRLKVLDAVAETRLKHRARRPSSWRIRTTTGS